FLATPRERQRAEFAAAILGAVADAKAATLPRPGVATPERTPRRRGWPELLSLRRPALRFSLAAMAALFMLGSFWLITETIRLRAKLEQLRNQHTDQEQKLLRQSAGERARHEQLSGELERERQERLRLEREMARRQTSPAGRPSWSPNLPNVLSFALSPGLVRDSGEQKKLLVAPDSELRLQLDLKRKGEYVSYRAVLQTAEGAEVWSQDLPKARANVARQSVFLHLPARLLPEGDYQLTLKGRTASGEFEEAGDYYFNIVKK